MSRAKKKNINNSAERRAGWVFGRGKVAEKGEIKGGVIRPLCLVHLMVNFDFHHLGAPKW